MRSAAVRSIARDICGAKCQILHLRTGEEGEGEVAIRMRLYNTGLEQPPLIVGVLD